MKKTPGRKLRMNRETLHQLGQRQLGQVAGGDRGGGGNSVIVVCLPPTYLDTCRCAQSLPPRTNCTFTCFAGCL